MRPTPAGAPALCRIAAGAGSLQPTRAFAPRSRRVFGAPVDFRTEFLDLPPTQTRDTGPLRDCSGSIQRCSLDLVVVLAARALRSASSTVPSWVQRSIVFMGWTRPATSSG